MLQEIKELEETLRFLIKPTMDIDQKIKALGDSFFRSHNTGYCNYMAGEEMGGVCNAQTEQWDLDCQYKWEVARLIDLLKAVKEEQ
jgi:hypothetical protein